MASLPSGTVTLLFTDIEDSSRLWDMNQTEMAAALGQHNDIVRQAIDWSGGIVVKDKGDGFFAVFTAPHAALGCVVAAQQGLVAAVWPESIGAIKVRMALHTGSVEAQDGDYHGPAVNKVARIEGLARGGQVLLSESARALTQDQLPDGVELIDLGPHALRGIAQQAQVYQMVAPGLPVEFPPLVTAGAAGVPLPDFLSSFVGRETEQEAIAELFNNDRRLVTLLGPGGIGKTRLAVETARGLDAVMTGGAFFADLTAIEKPGDVAGALAEAVGVHSEGAVSPMAFVSSRISEPTLLVVDNFEHVQSANTTVSELLGAAPDIRLLATSRTPLQVRGETIVRVEPLSAVNGDGQTPPALQLLYERAASFGVEIPREGKEAEAARSIAQRIDGIPLAIELVAARTRIIGVVELDAMLRESLDAMGSGGSELPERQRTIRSTIDWSLQNVSEAQRVLFRRMAALPAGATIKSLSAIAAPDQDGDLLDNLTGLVDNSLVQVVPGLAGGTRYRQLVPLREYGAELLGAAGEYDMVMGRLVDFYVDSAVELKGRFEFGEDAEKELRVDHANLLAAMRWSLDHHRAGDLTKAFNDFWVYWFNADVGVTAVEWLRAADAVIDTPYMDWFVGFFAFQSGDFDVLAERMHRAIEGFALLGDHESLARAKMFAGGISEDIEEGRRLVQAALDYFTAEDFGVSRFLPLLFLSINSVQHGEVAEAITLRRELLTWAERADYGVLIAWGHWNLALALLGTGATEEAEFHARESLAFFVAHRYQEGIASAADVIGAIEAGGGNHATAIEVFGAANAITRQLQTSRWFEAAVLVDAAMKEASETLGPEAVKELLARGENLSLDALINLVSDRG